MLSNRILNIKTLILAGLDKNILENMPDLVLEAGVKLLQEGKKIRINDNNLIEEDK